jgi:hypothetical protein
MFSSSLFFFRQDDMTVEATADTLMGEQTWPTEQEMQMNDNLNEDGVQVTEAQDEEDYENMNAEGEDGEEDNDRVEGIEDFMAGIKQLKILVKDKKKAVKWEGEDEEEDDMDMDDLASTVSIRKKSLIRDKPEEENEDFVDTPIDIPARQRFARYRALQSFRTSHWNPKENLPSQYGRIFQFSDMKGMQRRLLHQLDDLSRQQIDPIITYTQKQKVLQKNKDRASVGGRSRSASLVSMEYDNHDETGSTMAIDEMPGYDENLEKALHGLTLLGDEDYIRSDQLISIELEDVPAEVIATYQRQQYLIFFALHSYEYKQSVVHYQIRRIRPAVDETGQVILPPPIKSKEILLFHVSLLFL